jgi:hypothetical protein
MTPIAARILVCVQSAHADGDRFRLSSYTELTIGLATVRLLLEVPEPDVVEQCEARLFERGGLGARFSQVTHRTCRSWGSSAAFPQSFARLLLPASRSQMR